MAAHENSPPEYQRAIRDDRSLSSIAKLAALTLSVRYPNIRPSLATLAGDTSLSKPTVLKALAELEEKGWLRISRSVTVQGDQANNRYMLVAPGVVKQVDHGGKADCPRVVKQIDPKSQVKTQVKTDKESKSDSDKNQMEDCRITREQAEVMALGFHADMGPDDVIAAVRATNWALIRNPAGYIRSGRFLDQMPTAARVAKMARGKPELSSLVVGLEGLEEAVTPCSARGCKKFTASRFRVAEKVVALCAEHEAQGRAESRYELVRVIGDGRADADAAAT